MNQQFAEKSWFNIRLESREVSELTKQRWEKKLTGTLTWKLLKKKRVNREIKSAHGLFDGKRMHADTSQ